MAILKDRTGHTYGRLKVTARAANGPGGKARWICRCDCGAVVEAGGWDLSGGRTQSCGCLQKERTAAANIERTRHGHARADGGNKRATTPEYRSWACMKERCLSPGASNYHLYGGRGISICHQWTGPDGFITFLRDMGERRKGTTLDRIDVDGDYTPENCRWATAKQQARNRRVTPELEAARIDALNRGREKMWSDPDIRERLLRSRRKKKKA